MACPFCNGKTGIEWYRTERFHVHKDWGEDGWEDADMDKLINETKPRCEDCGKIVPATLMRIDE